jgi:putative redox protein
MISSHSLTPSKSAPIRLEMRGHELVADFSLEEGGENQGPGPHDFFNASLCACKSLTATWYAKKLGFPLTGVDVEVTADNSKERHGEYKLTVKVTFHGPLTDEQKEKLYTAVAHCPIHRLMTQTKITIEDVR